VADSRCGPCRDAAPIPPELQARFGGDPDRQEVAEPAGLDEKIGWLTVRLNGPHWKRFDLVILSHREGIARTAGRLYEPQLIHHPRTFGYRFQARVEASGFTWDQPRKSE